MENTETPHEAEQPVGVTYVSIRTLGKGAFGKAVLYRRIEDNSLVVWKEVALTQLSDKAAADAEKEVEILALLDHTNVITYYNHFVDSGTLLIEMEYANGGNLYQKICHHEQLLEEQDVIWYFYQILSAVSFIHDVGIIHRDIKSLNIFLTKGGLCKLGDFGISKLMDSKSEMANSVVGTPYYMSPEIVKGEPYDFKSDIWALGCVLYELCTLKRVFEASNALRLASAIVKGDYQPISIDHYTSDLCQLVDDMLKQDPTQRPSAKETLNYPCVAKFARDIDNKVWKLNSSTRLTRLTSAMVDSQPTVVSQSTEVFVWGGGKSTPRKIDAFTGAKAAAHVSCNKNHFAVLTAEKELYTWTSSHGQAVMVGQLGHGDTAAYKNPRKVQFFDGVPLKQVCCGEEFTVCLADDGTLYTFGGDYYGCLAQSFDQVLKPTQVMKIPNHETVVQVSAGDCHVVILTSSGKVFTWGCGEFGRLGLGHEDDVSKPKEVILPVKQQIASVVAGPDCTFLITNSGRVLACGNNEHNKLGLNSEVRGVARQRSAIVYDTPCVHTMRIVKPLRNTKIAHISSGPTHTAAITYYGQLLTFGSNKHGQLGLGDYRDHPNINLLSGIFAGRKVTQVSCGDSFTVVGTEDNQIFAFGNCMDGRLGISTSTQGIALPRAIFGSLHAVSSICSSHWTTILVADHVLSQKTIASGNTSKMSVSSGNEEQQENGLDERDSNEISTTFLMSSTPAWVKQMTTLTLKQVRLQPKGTPVLLEKRKKVKLGKTCSAPNCSNTWYRDIGLSFFRFPKDPERCRLWLKNTGNSRLLHKSSVVLNKNNSLCADHFEDSEFTNWQRNRLIWKAVPTIFHGQSSVHKGKETEFNDAEAAKQLPPFTGLKLDLNSNQYEEESYSRSVKSVEASNRKEKSNEQSTSSNPDTRIKSLEEKVKVLEGEKKQLLKEKAQQERVIAKLSERLAKFDSEFSSWYGKLSSE